MKKRFVKWFLGYDIKWEIEHLWTTQANQDNRLAGAEEAIEQLGVTVGYNEGTMNKATGILIALLDYLKVEYKKEWEDDPSFDRPMPRQREVIKIYLSPHPKEKEEENE